MLIVILFGILLWQRILIKDRLNDLQLKRANLGVILLGVMSVLTVTFNLTLHRGFWDGDFFSPFFSGFKH